MLPGRNAEQVGRTEVLPNCFKAQSKIRALQKKIYKHDCQDRDHERPRAKPQAGKQAEVKRLIEWHSSAHGGYTWPLPWPEYQINGQGGRDKIQTQATKDLIHATKRLKSTSQQSPQSTSRHPGKDR